MQAVSDHPADLECQMAAKADSPDANNNCHVESSASDGKQAEALEAARAMALRGLENLTGNDITEIKRVKNAPAGVKLVLMGVKPARVKDPQSAKFVESYAAASQKMLADKDFMNSLLNFDKDHIEPKALTKLQTYTSMPEMQPERVKKTFAAAYGLCCWVHAMEMFGRAATPPAAC